MDLVPGTPLDEQADLDKKVARSRRIAEWYGSDKRRDMPSRRLDDYASIRRTKAFSATLGVLNGYFSRAKQGDLVIVPPQSVFSNALIGELLDGPTDFSVTQVPLWGDEAVPSREVKWLATVPRGDFSLDLQRRFPSPNAFRVLDADARTEVYRIAYGNYSFDGSFSSRFDVTSADFSTKNDYYLQQIFTSIAAICQHIESGYPLPTGIASQSWDPFIALLTDHAYIPSLTININSPGSLALSCARLVPLVAAGLLALTDLGADATWHAATNDQLVIMNSDAPQRDPCTAQVEQEIREQLNLMGYERWTELCKRALELKKATGLKEKSKAKH